MDYEKKYKEAIATAKDCLKDGTITSTAIDYIETIFPELAESEDEKIRKTLIDFFKDWGKTRSHCWSISIPKILTWLEKQGDQKHEKKELKTIDWSKYIKYEPNSPSIIEESSWNKEDEERLQSCLNILQPRGIMGVTETINTKWLKSLKDRVQPQPKQEWSEEDENMANDLIEGCLSSEEGIEPKVGYEVTYEKIFADWLKALKDRIKGKEDKQ